MKRNDYGELVVLETCFGAGDYVLFEGPLLIAIDPG